MHIPVDTANEMATILGCQVSHFPQTYLGLPLTPHKLRVSDFQPLIFQTRHIPGWLEG